MKTTLATIGLLLAGSLSGEVTGHVVDEEGVPIGGAQIRVYPRESFETTRARAISASPEAIPFKTTETRKDGSFSFDTEGNAMVDVLADHPGRRPAYRTAINGEEARTIVLRKGKPRRVRITGSDGPVPDAVIVDRFFVSRTDNRGITETAEADGGIFESPWVIHRRYAMRQVDPLYSDTNEEQQISMTSGIALNGQVFAEDGHTPVSGAKIEIDGWNAGFTAEDGSFAIPHAMEAWRAIKATDHDRVGVATRAQSGPYTILLLPAGTIHGTVRTTTNKPVAGALVWIQRPEDDRPQQTTVSAADGDFSIASVPSGTYGVHIGHLAYSHAPRVIRVAQNGGRVRHDIAVTPLPMISGVVFDEHRRPVPSVFVTRHHGGQPNITGAHGRFVLRAFSMEGLVLVARKPGYAPGILGPLSKGEGVDRRNAALVLPQGFPARITVADRAGATVAGEPVRIMLAIHSGSPQRVQKLEICSERIKTCRTASDGTLRLQLIDGTYEITVGGRAAMVRNVTQQFSRQTSSLKVTVDRAIDMEQP